jgi:tagatose-1,6-bisphosphate aldolase
MTARRRLTIGKLRGLRQCSDASGALSLLALDHRNNLRKALRPDAPGEVPDPELTAFKVEAAAALAGEATAVLLDPELGAAQAIASGALPGDRGLIVALERTGYGGTAHARESRLLPNWGPGKVRRMGASGAKLLVYYHPASTLARAIEELVASVAEECAREDLPLMLEPLIYNPAPGGDRLTGSARRDAVVETARRLTIGGVDLLKSEFPADSAADADWSEACRELSDASAAAWIILSAAVDFDTFLRQAEAACASGASGVAVGRAVWNEAAPLTGEARAAFLRGEARRRMAATTALCAHRARPWTERYAAAEVDAGWLESY